MKCLQVKLSKSYACSHPLKTTGSPNNQTVQKKGYNMIQPLSSPTSSMLLDFTQRSTRDLIPTPATSTRNHMDPPPIFHAQPQSMGWSLSTLGVRHPQQGSACPVAVSLAPKALLQMEACWLMQKAQIQYSLGGGKGQRLFLVRFWGEGRVVYGER